MQKIDLHPDLLLVYTEKEEGNIDNRFGTSKEVKANRKKIFEALGLEPAQIVEGEQVHAHRVLSLNADNSKMWQGQKVTGVDGFITNQDSIALMLRLADCASVVLYDPQHHAIGAFHAGWRGAVKNIHLLGLQKMIDEYGTEPKSVIAWIGPCAQSCCYRSAQEPEQAKEAEWKPFIKKSKGEWSIDLSGYLKETLSGAGLLKKNMKLDNRCTVTDDALFSHQRSVKEDAPEKRFAVIAKLQKHS